MAAYIGFAVGLRQMPRQLSPGFVRTRIGDSARNRLALRPARAPDPTSPAGVLAAKLAELSQAGLDPSHVAARVLTAIREDELYVFTRPEMLTEAEERFALIRIALDKAASRRRSTASHPGSRAII
jgi:hypothetical protein